MYRTIQVCLILFFCSSITAVCQSQEIEEDHSYVPMVLKLNEDGSKYIRFAMWHQLWVTSNNLSEENSRTQFSTSIRRSRFLAFSQISSKFFILTHFGLNSLSANNLTSFGNDGDASQLFLHGAWGEVMINRHLYIGGGLHYWNGLTRLANQSTVNFMTLDQSRPFNAWHSLGVTDQFGRHIGIYLKGASGRYEYRFAWNNPKRTPLNAGTDYSSHFSADGIPLSSLTYTGVSTLDEDGRATGNSIFTGYVKHNFWESESTKVPYYPGTYLGKKKVLALGAGFFIHPNGMYNTKTSSHESVSHFAADVYMDMPTSNGALNAYVAIQSFDYGENYISRWGGTGTAFFTHVGYYVSAVKLMPYIAYSNSNYDGADDPIRSLDLGVNYFINDHHCKVTAEYHTISNDYRESGLSPNGVNNISQIRIQLHIFL